jgi:hypothetical protein
MVCRAGTRLDMQKKISRLSRPLTFVWIVCALLMTREAGADDRLDSLTLGNTTFSNVTVTTKTSADIYFNHAYGFGNAKVRDVDRETLLKLGYQLKEEKPRMSVFDSPAITNIVSDPRVQQAEAMLAARAGELLDRFDDRLVHGIAGGIIFFHLLYSLLGRMICVKAGTRPGLLIWIPFFQHAALLRAAGISGWWLFPSLIPPVGLVIYIWWGFRISKVRQKSPLVGVMMLLPITNILAFFYLALSGTGKPDPSTRNIISLNNPPRREAA